MAAERRGALPSADGGKERYFVAGGKRGVPGGEFLIARGHQRPAIGAEFGTTGDVLIEERLNERAFGEMYGIPGAADNFPQRTEEEHLDLNGWSGRGHT